MFIFIDESGDAGFKFNKGSSRHFVIAAVIFDNPKEAEAMEKAIRIFKENLGFIHLEEFKFNKSNRVLRMNFMKAISKYVFRIHFLSIDKTKIKDIVFTTKDSFYIHAIKMLLKNSGSLILDAVIKLDGSGDKIFRRSFIANIKKELNTKDNKIVRELKFSNSKTNLLIQMADMVAGSIRKSCEGDSEAKDIIRKHIEVESAI